MARNRKRSNNVKSQIVKSNALIQQPRIRGSGDYEVINPSEAKLSARVSKLESRLGPAPTSLIKDIASYTGRAVGNKIGMGDAGSRLGSGLATLFGCGDYVVKANSLMGVGLDKLQSSQVPKFGPNGKRGVRITEREYVGDIFSGGTVVSGSTTFNLASLAIQPGNASCFPWLSTVAQQFEQWDPQGIVFEFVSTSSAYNGTSQALGTVIAATDYNPTAPSYISKMDMENADYSNSCKAADNLMHGIECDPEERGDKVLLVRNGALGSNDNLKFYDLGNFQLATIGQSVAGVNLGELWVSYDIVFYKKQLQNGPLGNNISFAAVSVTGGITSGTLFGQLNTQRICSGNLPVRYDNGFSTFYFPPGLSIGRFLIIYCINGTTVQYPTGTPTMVNCSITAPTIQVWNGLGVGPFASNPAGATALGYLMVAVTGPNASLRYPSVAQTAPTTAFHMIIQLPYATQAQYVEPT